MDVQKMKEKGRAAWDCFMALRFIVDMGGGRRVNAPALYVLLMACVAPRLCMIVAMVGFLFRYNARFETSNA